MTHTPLPELSYAFSIRVPGRAFCPGCGVHITQRTWAVRHDVVMCLRCAEFRYDCTDWISLAIRWYHKRHGFTTERGISFWQPTDPGDGIVTLYLETRHDT